MRKIGSPLDGEVSSSVLPCESGHDPVEVKEEESWPPFDSLVEKIRFELLYGGRAAGSSRRRAPRRKKVVTDPPGSTLSTATSLADLRALFGIPDDVEFLLPSPNGRAECPPENYFTVYESYFSLSYLWFPIRELILRFLKKYGLALS